MLTPAKRMAKIEAIEEAYQKKLRKEVNNPLGTLTPSEVVDANIGGLADLA
jgi:hypothetical protein